MAATYDGSIILSTKVDTSGAQKGLGNIEGMAGRLGNAFKKLGGIIAGAFAVRQIIAFSKECIELGSDLEEVQNVVNVTFGEMSEAIDEFARTAATQFGLSELSAKQYTSTIGAMFKSMGMSGDAVTEMSIKMAELTGDMASFYNLDTDEAFQKIRAGIAGETEPLKQLGINLSVANLEQYRLAQGIATAYNQMTQQEQALLRYNYLLSVTSDAQGDFARTSNSWANQTRILNLQLQSIKANLGQGFINLLTPALQLLNKVLEAVAKVASAFKALTVLLTGKNQDTSTGAGSAVEPVAEIAAGMDDAATSAGDYADAMGDAAVQTKKAAKEAENYLSPLDHINKYQKEASDTGTSAVPSVPKSSGSSSLPSSAGAASQLAQMDFGKLEEGDTVVDKLALKMKGLLDLIVDGCKPAVDALKNLWDNGLKKLGEFYYGALVDFYHGFLEPVGSWVMGTGIPGLVNALNEGLMSVNWDRISEALARLWDALAPFAINVGEGLLWFWTNVLVPLGTWTANEILPRFFDTLSTVITIANNVLIALQPLWQWFWDNVLQPIATWTGGIFLDIWDRINTGLKSFSDWCATHGETIRTVATIVAAFFAAWAAVEFVGKIITIVKTLGTFIAGIGKLVSSFSPLVVIIGAVIAVGVLMWQNWDTIKEKCPLFAAAIEGLIAGLKTALAGIIEFLTAVFSGDWAAAWSMIKTAATTAWLNIKSTASSIWEHIKKAISDKWEAIKTSVGDAITSVQENLSEKWDAITQKVSDIWNAVTTSISDKWTEIKSNVSGAIEYVKSLLAIKWDSIKTAVISKWEEIKNSIYEKWETIKTNISNAIDYVKSLLSIKWDSIKTAVTTKWEAIKTAIYDKWETIKTTVSDAITVVKSTLSVAWTLIGEKVSEVWGTIKDTLFGVWKAIREKVSLVFTAVKNAIVNAFETALTLIKAPINGIIGAINWIIGCINDMLAGIEDALQIDIDIPNPFGGRLFYYHIGGLELPRVPTIPYLATGAVIPPNAPFLATLGDQRNGQNLEAPEGLIRQIFREEGSGKPSVVNIYIDRKKVFEAVVNEARDRQRMNGNNPFELA